MKSRLQEVYRPDVEKKMRNVYESLSEKDGRRYVESGRHTGRHADRCRGPQPVGQNRLRHQREQPCRPVCYPTVQSNVACRDFFSPAAGRMRYEREIGVGLCWYLRLAALS